MEVYKGNNSDVYNACCLVDRSSLSIYVAAQHLKYSEPDRTYVAITSGQYILILDLDEG